MKKPLIILCWLMIAYTPFICAQGWTPYHDDVAKVEFELPTDALVVDSLSSLHTIMYSSEVDSILGLQVHVFDSAYLNMEEDLFAIAMEKNEGDELRAIAQIFLLATNSDLLSLEEITNNMDERGIEIGLEYLSIQSDYPAISFIRFFLINNRFIAFSISGSKEDMPRLMDYKDAFYNSVNFY